MVFSFVDVQSASSQGAGHPQVVIRDRLQLGLPEPLPAGGQRGDGMDFDTMKMDMQYLDNWSLALDGRVLLLTIPKVLTGKGAY
jgi:lipopolysaccharide/colanic/teichoic acid biosynthesis glycosyltransferase